MPPARPQVDGRLTKIMLMMVAGLVTSIAFVRPIHAADWELVYGLTETLRGSDNINLRKNPKGPAGSSRSSASFNLMNHARTFDWGLSGGIGYLSYFGQGAPETRSILTGSAGSNLAKRTRDTDYTLSAFFSVTPASTTELTELGIVNLVTDRLNYGLSAGLVHRVNKRDSLKFTARANRIDFTELSDSLKPRSYLSTKLEWSRRMTRSVDGRLVASFGWKPGENNIDSDSLTYAIALGTNAKLTRRLTLDASAGVSIVDRIASDPLFPLANRTHNLLLGFNGGLAVNYLLSDDASLNLSFSQRLGQDELGDLRQYQSVRGSFDYSVNDHSSVSVSAAFTNSTGSSSRIPSRQTYSFSPRYTHKIARHWDAIMGYQWAMTDNRSGPRRSNSVYFTLSHSGTILP